MNKDILVRMDIPIIAYGIVNTPLLVFNRWMPLEEKEFIVIQEDNATLRLWFDRSCWGRVTHRVADLHRHVNVLVDKVFADVMLHDLPEDLVNYIKLTASEPAPPTSPYQQTYRELGKKVYCLAITYFNRLIGYARSMKGQYWLREYPIEKAEGLHSVNVTFNARVLIESEWIRWYPDVRSVNFGRVGGCQDRDRFIDKESWNEVKKFVVSNERTSLVWELLAGAEWLAGIGHRRSALTEAITALETAISLFASKPSAEEAFDSSIFERMNVNSLKKAVEHMGLSGTVHYLFPVIFSEEKMPARILRNCQEAVQRRQNVVHNGQRDVRENDLSTYLEAIRQMCQLLEMYQEV